MDGGEVEARARARWGRGGGEVKGEVKGEVAMVSGSMFAEVPECDCCVIKVRLYIVYILAKIL